MSFYFTDIVSHTSITIDPNHGTKSGTPVSVKCRIEDTNKIIHGPNGENIEADSLIMWPSNVTIKPGDTIKKTSIMGVAVTENKSYQVIQTMPAGGFSQSHIEVYI